MTATEHTGMRSAKWFGKQKAVIRDTAGQNGSGQNGTVLQLQRVGDGAFDTYAETF